MSPEFAVFLLMNNYFHDVATAMLLACAIVLWSIEKAEANARDKNSTELRIVYATSVMRLVWFSVAWIIVSGAVRIATLEEFEWNNFAEKGLLSGLIAKYVIALVMMALGGYLLFKQERTKERTACSQNSAPKR